jgi:RHS repeat-associated protein
MAEYNETSGALIREYVWNGWDPVAVIEGGVISFVRADHIGRPVFATNSAGVKVWSATYLPFGGVHVSTGNLPANRFPGQWFQSESGLHQNWMRDYDPTTGRYLQADPLGLVAGMNVYGYAHQSPMRFIDPDGRNPLIPGVIGAIIGAGIGYYETGCIEGLVYGGVIGFATGLGVGALGLTTFYSNALASGTSGVLADIAVTLGTEGICGCKQQKLNWKRSALIFSGSALMGPLGGYSGRSVGSGFGSPFWSDVAEGLGGGIFGEFGGQVGSDMGSN